MIHTVKGFSVVNEVEVDIFAGISCLFLWCNECSQFGLWFLCFDLWSLVSGYKFSFYIWKYSAHVLLKSNLKNFEYYLASMWKEHNYMAVRTFFGTAFLWNWNENWPFPILWLLLVFQICWHIECSTLTSSFRIWNNSAGIPSSPLALFIVMLLRSTWFQTSGCLVLGGWPHHRGYPIH